MMGIKVVSNALFHTVTLLIITTDSLDYLFHSIKNP